MGQAIETCSMQLVSEAVGCDISTIWRRAKREDWQVVPRAGRGGGKNLIFAALPEEVRAAVIAHVGRKETPQSGPALNEKQRRKALAKADVVRLYVEALSKAGHGSKMQAREDFLSAYLGGMWPDLLQILGKKVSWKSIERWKLDMEKSRSALKLADRRGGHNRDKTKLTQDHLDLLISAALDPKRPHLSEVARRARTFFAMRGLDDNISDMTLIRQCKLWAKHNHGQWVWMRRGAKAWNDECAYAIPRDYDKISVGDILVADGHKLNFETLNPETGKPDRMELVLWYDMASSYPLGWEVLPTENTENIAAAFRRACMRLGKFPKVAYLDNGRAFRGKFFTATDLTQSGIAGVFYELGVQTMFAWPYHGQSKTIERFFKTFGELERFVPSYVGTSIETKPPRMSRGEKMHQKVYAASSARPLTIAETHAAIAWYFDEYTSRNQPKSHLRGRSPHEVFAREKGPGLTGPQLEQLQLCMLSKDIRRIHKNGISLFGEDYYDSALYGRRHPVVVRYDRHSLDAVLVYDEAGVLLCEARKVRKVHPAARILGNADDLAVLEDAIAMKKRQEKDASTLARDFLESVVVPETQRRMDAVATTKKQSQAQDTVPPKLSAAKVQAIEAARDEHTRRKATAPAYLPPERKRDITTELERYDYLFHLLHRDGVTLRDEDTAWMKHYEQTDEFQTAGARRYAMLRDVFARRAGKATGAAV